MVTLDREEDLAAALDDPALFLDALGTPAVIDEVQRAATRCSSLSKSASIARSFPGSMC